MGGCSPMFFLLEPMKTRESLAALQQKGKQKRKGKVNQTKKKEMGIRQKRELQSQFTSCV
jgi:hypothetical protein